MKPRRYELVGREGRIPSVLVFLRPWGLYVRTKRFRITLGPMFGRGLRVHTMDEPCPNCLSPMRRCSRRTNPAHVGHDAADPHYVCPNCPQMMTGTQVVPLD